MKLAADVIYKDGSYGRLILDSRSDLNRWKKTNAHLIESVTVEVDKPISRFLKGVEKCDFCDGQGEREINVDGRDCPSVCTFCNGTGVEK